MKKIICLLLLLFSLGQITLAQKLSPLEEKKIKNQLAKFQKEITRLQDKLKKTKDKKTRGIIIDKIDSYRAQIKKLEQKISPSAKPKVVSPGKTPSVISPAVTEEAPLEEVPATVEVVPKRVVRFRLEGGGVFGLFSAGTAFMVEARFPLNYVFGAATSGLRLTSGLVQSKDLDRRYLPLNFDLIFKFPPGVFTGLDNYLGAGLNYVLRTTGGSAGTFGGQVFYGVESEGFGGVVFGEIGYGILRTGFSPSHRGTTVLVGYRRMWEF